MITSTKVVYGRIVAMEELINDTIACIYQEDDANEIVDIQLVHADQDRYSALIVYEAPFGEDDEDDCDHEICPSCK